MKGLNAIILHESKETITLPSELEDACYNHLVLQGEVLSYPSLNPFSIHDVKQVVCNEDSTLSLTSSGLVYGWGLNSSNLLHPDPIKVNSPSLISKLSNIVQISISSLHAAALDSSGLLYTWGSPLNGRLGYNTMQSTSSPELVLSSRAFKSIQVVCGSKFTSVRTDGCYLHIYGDLGFSHSPVKLQEVRSPKAFTSYSHPELDKHSIVEISAGRHFLASLSENGEVFVFDGCMDVVKLPVHSEAKVISIRAGERSVWGVTQDFLMHWKANDSRSRNYCELASWSADVFDTSESTEQVKVFQWGSGFLIVTEKLEEPVHQLRPYKRSEYAKRLFHNALESPSLSLVKEDRVPVVSFEDLERLFPNGDSQHTMEKIMKLRMDHYKYEILLKAFAPLIHPLITAALNKLKDYSWMKYLYHRALKVSNLVSIFASHLKHIQSMNKMKFLWKLRTVTRVHLVISNSENVEIIENTCGLITRKHFENFRDFFTAIRIGKPVKLVEKFRVKIRKFILNDLFFAFHLWKVFAKKPEKLRKIAGISKRFLMFLSFFKLKFGVEKLRKQLKALEKAVKVADGVKENYLKKGFDCFRSNITNNVLVRFHKKYVLELFLKLLSQTLTKKLFSLNSEIFSSIKHFKKQKYFKHPLAQFLLKLSLRIKNQVFKSLTLSKPEGFYPLRYLLKSRFHSTLSQILMFFHSKHLKKIASFSITLSKVLSNSIFKKKLHIFYRLKHKNLSRTHSLNKEDDIENPIFDSSSEISKRSLSRNLLDPYLTSSADQRFYHRGHSASSPNAVRRSHCCFHGSPCFSSPKRKDFRYYKGAKVSYERYLVLKKIDELKDQPLREVTSPLHTPKKKKSANDRPPWKPASVYTHSTGQKTFSAIKKGFEYNEALRRKLMKQRASHEMSESKMTIVTHDKALISKVSRKPVPEGLSNIVSLPACRDTLNIGLAFMVVDRACNKVVKRMTKEGFDLVKMFRNRPCKLPAPTPFDSPKAHALNETLNLIKSDWQLGIVVIATDKIRMCFRRIFGNDLFQVMKKKYCVVK